MERKRNLHLWDAVAHQFSVSCGAVGYTEREGAGDALRLMDHSMCVRHLVSVLKKRMSFTLENLVNLLLTSL